MSPTPDRADLSTPTRQARQSRPELAVVVIGLGAPPELIEAVRSINEQAVPLEVVVINSGGGDAPGLLARAGVDVPVFETQERLFVGAARNIGIRQTTAPYAAFLASDCLATPGWAAERLRLHRSGEPMVASAVMPFPPDHLVSWAHHLLLFPHRLPGLAAVEALRYGVSFDRKIFGEYGVFDGGLATGEDTEFLDRMRAKAEPAWTSTVVTLHRNVTTGPALLRDQLVRGYRYGHAMYQIRDYSRLGLAKLALGHSRRSKRLAKAGLSGRELEMALASLWWLRIGCLAKALGILASPLAAITTGRAIRPSVGPVGTGNPPSSEQR